MIDKVKGYVIFNITRNKYIFNGLSEGRQYFIYGDLGSARRKMTALKDSKEYKNDKLRIVEMIPNEDWK